MAHGLLGSSGIVSVRLRQVVEAPFEAHDGDGEVGQAGEVARQVTGVYAATVLVIGDVAHVVKTIFDAPMPAHERQDELGGGLFRGKRGQPMGGLVLHDAGLTVLSFTLDAERDPAMGELADNGCVEPRIFGERDLVRMGGPIRAVAVSTQEIFFEDRR